MKNKKEEKLAQSPPLSPEKKGQTPDQILHELRAEGSLQNSEFFLSSFTDQIPYPIWISDAQGTLIRLNQACRALLNISDEDVVGKYNVLKDNIVEEQGFLPLVRRVFEEGETARFELKYDSSQLQQLQLRHFTFVILDVSVFPIRDASGRITNAVFQHMDITERKRVEETLQESEKKLSNLFDNAIEGVFQTTPEGRLITANGAFARMFGYESPEEVINTVTDMARQLYVNPDERKKLVDSLKEMGYLNNFECRMRQKDGRTFWANFNARLTETVEGIPCFEGFIIDITERKQAEEKLRQSEERYRTIIEEIDEGYYEVDLAGNYTFVNDSMIRKLQYSREELIGMNYRTYIPRDELEGVYQTFNKAYRTGEIIKWFPMTNIRKDGKPLSVEDSVSCLRDKEGRIIGFRGVSRDVTERKQAEEKLRESEKKYRELYDFLPIPVYEMDFEANITSANRAIYETFRGTEEDLKKGFKGWQLLSAEEVEKSSKNIERLLKGEQTEGTEYNFKRLDGSVFPAIVISSVIYSNDKPVGLRGAVVDITERKEAEEALRKSEKRLRKFYEVGLVGVIYWNTRGQIQDANDKFLQITGYTRDDLFNGKIDWLNMTPPEYKHLDENSFRELKAIGVNREPFEKEYIRKDETRVPVLVAGAMLDDERINGVAVILDITERKRAEEHLQHTLESLRKALGGIIQVISGTVETRDPYTAGHQRRVADLARAIAGEMGLPDDRRDGLRMAGTIHDLGKVSIPAEILSKPTKLTEIEYKLIQAHSQTGYDILKGIEFPWPIAEMVLQHHERMNGSGYPRGLKGEAISREARILMVADVVEAMASYRPYRPALGVDAALEEIEKNKGILYDPEVVEVCLRLFREKGFGFK